MRIATALLVAGLEAVGLFIPINTLKALPKNEIGKTPSYAGFADIQATKNYLIIVGDTQGTSHWEFWRERNDKERKLITDETTKHEPAFVIHLGDLTARGSSEKHWQQFDDTLVFRVVCLESDETFTVVDPLIIPKMRR